VIEWVIYYGDKTSWTNEDGPWEDAHAFNVQAVGYNDADPSDPADVGRVYEPEWKNDYYLWWPGARHPWCSDLAGVYDYLIQAGSPLANKPLAEMTLAQLAAEGVKFGRSFANREWREIAEWIRDDERLRPKSAWLPDERL